MCTLQITPARKKLADMRLGPSVASSPKRRTWHESDVGQVTSRGRLPSRAVANWRLRLAAGWPCVGQRRAKDQEFFFFVARSTQKQTMAWSELRLPCCIRGCCEVLAPAARPSAQRLGNSKSSDPIRRAGKKWKPPLGDGTWAVPAALLPSPVCGPLPHQIPGGSVPTTRGRRSLACHPLRFLHRLAPTRCRICASKLRYPFLPPTAHSPSSFRLFRLPLSLFPFSAAVLWSL